ncbi:hypothetical protein EDB81DRAFT_812100 [Dactylonectria macrodidyma]|uniref:Uncharacterized protein n=1 Tax=Dactylonectria macrodidyma TaxID=307937 RepID=A0A9P9IKZ4_9HYPO|nr:hypothetical protein EDB81DRAFT_812100 [Dactylonectria macrodidyma]
MERQTNHHFDPFDPKYDDSDGDDADLGNIDWDDPASFMAAMGGPIPISLSPTAVRREATQRLRNIFSSYEILVKILARHEETIQKRWTKKTRQQRLRILLKAWPDMPTSHRPDFEAFTKESPEQRERGTQHADSFMWPYINLEDLSQTRLLLLLLNARGHNPPSAFAGADNDAMHLGKVSRAIVPIFLNEHIMVLNGADSAEEYGKLLAWEDHEDAFEWMHTRKQYIPGEGLVILQAQERLLGFLVECCQELLHDIPADIMTSDSFPIQPAPPMKSESESLGFESLAVMAAEAPYRLPAQLDLGRIESLLGARASAAEDHLWTLREDPSYFAQQLLETRDHRQEMMKDTLGHPHPTTRRNCDTILWARVIGNVLTDAYLALELFSELHRQTRELQLLQQKYATTISPSKDLPKDYLLALLKFRYYLNQGAKGPLNLLKVVVVASPPMRKFYVREPSNDINSTKIAIKSKPGQKMTKVEGRLIWLLRTLWEDDKDLFFAGLSLVVDELERLLRAEQPAQELVSGYVMRVIGDISIIAQCLRQLNLYQPWAQNFENAAVDWEDDIENNFTQATKPWGQILAALREQNLILVAKLGEPSPGKFTYPISKRRTRENVDALRLAELNLDKVWIQADRVMYAAEINLDGTSIQRLLSQPRMLRRTPEWIEPTVKVKEEQVSDPDSDALIEPFSTLFSGLSQVSAGKITRSHLSPPIEPKVKVKTRGTTSKPQIDSTEASETTGHSPGDTQSSFPVDSRALKVFRTLFFNPTMTSTPAEVPWKDFLHAMISAGFKVEKLYGSVWQFSPTNLDVERSIHFHEPHPKGKLAFEVARRYGRRLNRAYGWFGGMFVLKEK